MTSILKERPQGGFYCNECRIGTSNLVDICPYCGSIITNYEELLTKNITETFLHDITSSPPPDEVMKYRSLRRTAGILEDDPMIDGKKLSEILKKWQEYKNESNIH